MTGCVKLWVTVGFVLVASSAHAQTADRDGDGIPDATDRCPSDAEDVNQFEDDDGCPDEPRYQQRLRDQHDASLEEQRQEQRRHDTCFATAAQRETSARGGYTSYDSAIEAWQACVGHGAPRDAEAQKAIERLSADRDGLATKRVADDIAKRHALADDYAAKSRVQYALGTTLGILAVGCTATALGFGLGQPLGRGEISNTVVGSIFLGFGIIFGVETYLRFDQAQIHGKSAKSIRPVSVAPPGLVIRF